MRTGSMLCLLLTVLVACGGEPPTEPPVRAAPKPGSAVLEVEATLAGASALEMEQQAALPIERALAEVAGVKRTTTKCEEGHCLVRLRLVAGTDVTKMRDSLQATLVGLKKLSGDSKVFLRPLATQGSPIALLLRPSGEAPLQLRTLRHAAETIVAPQLKQERGVSGVLIRGGHRPLCIVDADPNRLAAFDVTPLELAEVVGTKSQRAGGAGLPTMDEVLDAVVAMRADEPVYLRDLANARIEVSAPEPDAGTSVSVLVMVEPGTNTATLKAKISELALELPEGVLLETAKPEGPTASVWISHPKQELLMPLTEEVQAAVRDVPGVKSATVHRAENEAEVVVELHKELLVSIGVTEADVAAAVQLAFEGRTVGSVLHEKEVMELVVRLEGDGPQGLNRLKRLRVRTKDRGLLPVSSVVSLRHKRGPGTLFQMDGRRAALITIQLAMDANTEQVVEAVRLALRGLHGEIHVELVELGAK